MDFKKGKKIFWRKKFLFCRGLRKISNISLKKLIFIIILLFISLVISCTTNSSKKKGELLADSADAENRVSDTTIKTFPKSSFTQKEMEIFYDTVLGKIIIRGNKRFLPVTENKKPVFIACDCNNDGIVEFFILFAESISENDISDISIDSAKDLRNIYREDYLRQFLLAVYKYSEHGEEKRFLHEQSILLEDKGVFSSIKEIAIDKNNKINGISVNFITSVGINEDIIINKKESYSITSIKNTLSDSTIKKDIDDNGIIELLRYEKTFVDGFGVETFITCYKFNGEKFLPVKTVNTVKDLRSFIDESKMYLERKSIDLFLKKAVAPPVLKKLNLAKIGQEKILQRIFYPVKRESSHLIDINTMLLSGDDINFIFPEIFENPFRMDSDGIYSFTTYVRVLLKNDDITIPSDSGDDSVDTDVDFDADNILESEEIYLIKIYMSNNPFEDNRFFFFVN